jgi:hypothetical protein
MTKEELIGFFHQMDLGKYQFDCPIEAVYNETPSHRPVFEGGWLCLNGSLYNQFQSAAYANDRLAIKFSWGHIFIYPKQTVKPNIDARKYVSNKACDNTIGVGWTISSGSNTPVILRYNNAATTSITGTAANFTYTVTSFAPIR